MRKQPGVRPDPAPKTRGEKPGVRKNPKRTTQKSPVNNRYNRPGWNGRP